MHGRELPDLIIDVSQEMIGRAEVEVRGGAVSLSNKNSHDKPNIDHCHKTGLVRGLLCGHCNNLLGRCNDDVEILKNAVRYLNDRG